MAKKREKSFWEGILAKDNAEIERINKARERKDKKFLEKWFDRYHREGEFWLKDKNRDNNWL